MAATPTEFRVDLSLVQSGLIFGAMLIGWVFSLWRMAKVNQKKESELYTAIADNKRDINEVGGRVNATNLFCTKHDEAIQSLKIEQQQSRDDRGTMREKIAANQAAIAVIREELQEERLAVMSMLHANEKAATERDTTLRVELAGIRERLNIESIVDVAVRKLKAV